VAPSALFGLLPMTAIVAETRPVVAALFGLFGLVYGSFLTVVVYRVPRRLSIVAPRSACPGCGAEIRARDNVPVVSWLILRGRCRGCGARIPARYPLVELGTAGLSVGAALAFRDVYIAAGAALFLGLLLALALIDAEHRILPNAVVYPAMAGFAVGIGAGAVFGQRIDWLTAVIGFIAFGGVLFVIAIVVPNGMGMGHVKLAGLIGLALGGLGLRYVAVAAGTAVLAGGLGAIVALMAKRSRKATIPFGPFLAIGAAAALFCAPAIAHAYIAWRV